jgi:Domain of unknown function (DUF4148)
MKVKLLVSIFAVLTSAGSAFAQQREFVPADEGFVSTKSRAEVIAEMNQAKASGAYVVAGSEEFVGQFAAIARSNEAQTRVASKSRAEVVAELRQAEAAGNFVVGGKEYAGQHVVTNLQLDHSRSLTEGAGD